MPNLDNLTENQIIERLKTKTDISFDIPLTFSEQSKETNFRKASVLIPFVRQNDTWHILFIRRAESDKDRHSGQVAFVGGKAEEYDQSEIETALRETQEEIGVHPKDVNILGQIGSHYSISSFQITPVVATLLWPYDFTLNPEEVSHTFTLPLTWLADDSNYTIKYRKPPKSNQQVPVIYYDKNDGELLWGATARMMLSLIKTLTT